MSRHRMTPTNRVRQMTTFNVGTQVQYNRKHDRLYNGSVGTVISQRGDRVNVDWHSGEVRKFAERFHGGTLYVVDDRNLVSLEIPYDPHGEGETDDDI